MPTQQNSQQTTDSQQGNVQCTNLPTQQVNLIAINKIKKKSTCSGSSEFPQSDEQIWTTCCSKLAFSKSESTSDQSIKSSKSPTHTEQISSAELIHQQLNY